MPSFFCWRFSPPHQRPYCLSLSLCLSVSHSFILSFSAPLIGCVVQDISGIGEDGYGAKTLSKCVKEWTQYPSPNLTCNISVQICSFLLRQQQTCLHVRILMYVGLQVLMFQGFLHYHPQVYVVAKMLHELNTCENSLSNVVCLVYMSKLLCCFLMFSLAKLGGKKFILAKHYEKFCFVLFLCLVQGWDYQKKRSYNKRLINDD